MAGIIGNWDSAILTSADLREFPRLNVWGDAALRVTQQSSPTRLPVTLIDISHGGICFAVRQELAIGQRICLEMEPPGGATQPLAVEADVRWSVPDADAGEFRVGCSWTQQLSMDDLLKFC